MTRAFGGIMSKRRTSMLAGRRWRTSTFLALSLTMAACSGPRQEPSSAYRKQVLEDSPVAYWRLDETFGTSVFDQTQNNNNGTIEGAVSLQQTGATASDGNAASLFKKTGQVVVPNNDLLQMKERSVTLEAWIKPTSIQRGEVWILCKGKAGEQTEYGMVLMDGILAYQSIADLYTSKSDVLPQGTWSHVAVTIDRNTTGIFYVNGVEAGTFAPTGNRAITIANQPVMIGNQAGLQATFLGTIDEPAIYPQPLTGEQLLRHVTLAGAAPGR
jgi:hypothetical protein